MDYTCENCKQRKLHICKHDKKCRYFKLDKTTLSESEQELLRVMRQVMRENK